jgi:hypothetical protein
MKCTECKLGKLKFGKVGDFGDFGNIDMTLAALRIVNTVVVLVTTHIYI